MAVSGAFVIADNTRKLMKALDMLTKSDVLVGIPQAKDSRTDEDGEKSPIGNAAIGYLMDKGMPEQNVPARPWLSIGVSEGKDKIIPHLKSAAQVALSGDVSGVEIRLNRAGLAAQSAAKNKIRNGPFPKLSDRTLARRRRRGRTGTKPLIDQGKLLSAVSYVVRKK